jgi:hypothetical protein
MESKWIIALLLLPIVFVGAYFQGWFLVDFRNKIGNVWFSVLVLSSIILLIIVVTFLSR